MTILKNIKDHWLLVLVLILGIAFRFIPIGQYQFSHDELSALSRTIYPNFTDELTFGVMAGDTHPALIQSFLYYWVKMVGFNETAVKLPFLICGIVCVLLIYKFCYEFFSKKVALVSSSIISLSFIFLVYSSYARMYITGVLFCIMILYIAYKILFSTTVTLKHYLLFAISCLLCAYNHHMSCLFAFTVASLSLFYIPHQRLKLYLLFCLVTLLLYLPHLSITLYQFSIGGIGASVGGWLSAPRSTELYYFVKALFGCGISAKIIICIFFILIIISVLKLIPISKKQVFLFWIFLINYSIIHLYSVFKNPILQYSVLLFCGVCFIVLLSSFVEFLSLKHVYLFCGTLIILLCFQSLYKKNIFTKVHVQDFESQVKTTIDLQKQYGKHNVASIFKTEHFFVYVYEKKFATPLKYLSVEDSILQKPYLLRNYLRRLKQNFIVLGGVGAEDIALVKEYFPYLVSHSEDYFRNTSVYSKTNFHVADASLINTFTLLNSDVDVVFNKSKKLSFENNSVQLSISKNDDQFPFNLKLPLPKANFKLGEFALAEINYTTPSKNDIAEERICMAVSQKNKDAVFFKSTTLSNYFDTTKAIQTAYIEYFAGVGNKGWQQKNMDLNTFIWKAKNTSYTLKNVSIKQYSYNPTKWTLWD